MRLRALRNLRLKLATPELLLPSSPSAATAATGPPPSPQGMLRAFFAVHGPQLYAHLRSALLDEGDKALQGEALMLLAEVCRQPGQHAARRGLVAAGVADALAGAPGFERHEEARALAHDIRQTLLLATSLVEEDGAGGGGHEEEAGADVSMLGASVASGFTLGGRRRRESLPIPPLPTSSSSSSSGGAAADGEQMMPPPTEDEAGASTTRFSLSSSMPAPNDSEPALSRQQQQQQPPQPQQLAHLLLFEGWKFPPAPLGRADERRLFEFQVGR